MNDQTIESEIRDKGLTAPRVTPADIEANIVSEHYFTAEDGVHGESGTDGDCDWILDAPSSLGLLTFCVLVLRNGFTVTGESACASPENFDAEIGRKIARQNAVSKVWPLLGYELRSRLAAAERLPCPCPDKMGEFACQDRTQCWEPCGELGKSEAHVRVWVPNNEQRGAEPGMMYAMLKCSLCGRRAPFTKASTLMPETPPPMKPCPFCGGNDADMPCAYPSEGVVGCLRDRMKKLTAQERIGFLRAIAGDYCPKCGYESGGRHCGCDQARVYLREARQRVRAVAKELNTAVGYKGMADGRHAFELCRRRFRKTRVAPGVIVRLSLIGHLVATDQDGRRKCRLVCVTVPSPARSRPFTVSDDVNGLTAGIIEHQAVVFDITKDMGYLSHHSPPSFAALACSRTHSCKNVSWAAFSWHRR